MAFPRSNIPEPSVEELLPPFLAHIPIAFSSAKAPPSLLPLLAPILRSRVQLLSGGDDGPISSPAESWLSLLTWSDDGADLCQSLANQDFSPHPSGEFEIGEYESKGIKRSDAETLKATVKLLERDLEVTYVWVSEKEDLEEGSGWKIMDLNLSEGSRKSYIARDAYESQDWYPTVSAAEEAFRKQQSTSKAQPTPAAPISVTKETQNTYLSPSYQYRPQPTSQDDDDDDDYWNMYDQSPARSPAVQHQGMQAPSEDEYFARYSNVSPALDREQPSPPAPSHGYSAPQPIQQQPPPPPVTSIAFPPVMVPISPPTSTPSRAPSVKSATPPATSSPSTTEIKTHSPRARSPSDTQSVIEQLEKEASVAAQAEIGVKQHISTTLKSLYRLAKVAGIRKEEFDRVVTTELAVLDMMDKEDSGEENW